MSQPGTPRPNSPLAAGAALGVLVTAAVVALPAPALAQVQLAEALIEADPGVERTCLAELSRVGFMVTRRSGEMPEDSSYAEDLGEAVRDCRAGRIDDAMDKRAEIWAAVTLHQPHRS